MVIFSILGFRGGELELMMLDKKKGFEALANGSVVRDVDTEVISYENPGKMILAQGSEVIHHVTPLQSQHKR